MSTALRYVPFATASELARLDADMRHDLPKLAAIAARVRFYECAVHHFALLRLDRLGALVTGTKLSQQSLWLVLEDSRYSVAVLRRLVALAAKDARFRSALVEQEGFAVLASWNAIVHAGISRAAIAA